MIESATREAPSSADDLEGGDISAEDIEVPAADGFPLAATLYRPSTDGGAFVQVNGATAVHRRLYARYARFLAGRGLTVLTYDYRGTGDSLRVPIRRMRARMRHWGERDLTGVIDWVGTHFAAHRHVAVSHSVGGQLLCLAPNVGRLEAVYAIAAQWPSAHHWRAPTRWFLPLFFRVVAPLATQALGYFPGKLFGMGDLPKGIGLEWMQWCAGRDYMTDDDGSAMRPYADRLTARVRWIGFADDLTLGPPDAVRAIARVYRHADSDVRIIEPKAVGRNTVGHWGFFKAWAEKPLWVPSADWLVAH